MPSYKTHDDVLGKKEMGRWLDFFSSHPRQQIKKHGPKTLNISEFTGTTFFAKVMDLIASLAPGTKLVGGNLFQTSVPYIVHNDNIMAPSSSGQSVLIPLKIEPATGKDSMETFLVLFDQSYEKGPAKFFNQSKANLPSTGYPHLFDTQDIVGLCGQEPNSDSRLGHLKPEWLQGLSVEAYIPWQPGGAIVFPASRLHCSSNFIEEGIKSKTGLAIFVDTDASGQRR